MATRDMGKSCLRPHRYHTIYTFGATLLVTLLSNTIRLHWKLANVPFNQVATAPRESEKANFKSGFDLRTPGNQMALTLPPRKMSDTNNTIFFLHIGKCGGTSVDGLFRRLTKKRTWFPKRKYIGNHHFDWSIFEHRPFDPLTNADVISMLRNPLNRAKSQFYYSKRLPWAIKSNATFLRQTFDEYVMNPTGGYTQPLENTALMFLTGSYPPGSFVQTFNKDNKRRKEMDMNSNKKKFCQLAADHLDQMIWFGLLEEIPRSIRMLKLSLNMTDSAIEFPRANQGNKRYNETTSPEVIYRLESYLAMDLWLYDYAKVLFEARWNYTSGLVKVYKHPDRPPLPDFD